MSQLAHQSACTAVAPQMGGHGLVDYMRLPEAERRYIDQNLAAFRWIEEAEGGLTVRCREVARRIRHMGWGRGWSWQRLHGRYKLYRDGGCKPTADGKAAEIVYAPHDWRVLVRDYNCGNTGMPQEFKAYLVQLWSETTREKDSFRAVYHRLVRAWLAGEEIPGYGNAFDWYKHADIPMPTGRFVRPQDLPEGWSESNLNRTLKALLPKRSQRRAAQGQVNRLKTDWGAQLLRDRSALLPLQLWTIDDVRLDLQARMFVDGKWQIVYVDALFALDVATGYVLAYGIKGMATRGQDTEAGRDAGTKMAIDSRDVRHLVVHVLEKFGLPQSYRSTLLCEMATAKLSKDDEAGFAQLLEERLKIDYTGMGRGQLMKSGFSEEWGRPGLKGWIESYFRLLHTHLNHLPGTTGRRYELTRGDHADRIRYTTQLIRRAEKLIDGPLTPDHPLHEQLAFPILTVDEVNGVVAEMVEALNWRVQHRLQGFDRVFEFRDATGQWRPEADLNQLPPRERAGVELTPRMEAPAERLQRLFKAHAPQFQKLDPIVVHGLYTEKRSATVRGGRIALQDQRLGTDRMVFAAGDDALDKYEGKDGAVLAWLSPDASHVVLTDRDNGAALATLWREGRVDLTDEEALGKRAGEVHREQEREMAVIRDYLAPAEERLRSMRDSNETALEGAGRVDMSTSPLAMELARGRDQAQAERKREAGIRASTRAAARQITDQDFAEIAGIDGDEFPEDPDDDFENITRVLQGS